MNKQQLAAKIWESANQMRSQIEANEYKDYILGFIFYKYLSDKLVRFAKSQDFSDEDKSDHCRGLRRLHYMSSLQVRDALLSTGPSRNLL
ncbi:type I restriction-modification system subunit M N-terminal domain-containing protein [Candidatus Nitrotoga fabula]|uniref:type I restriction-modification system subunit M N-terminal domain-containing protein n=1 Tax=Candidatus Nitrotoga fabula TaxID=2182327 RepID=UPI001BB4854D|nr:type I restriction-modification system subunit M N-terminal domain-containing protein [Candidatus Nitrotoga fabula]